MVQLRDKDLSILNDIFARWPQIASVRVFGSRATGKAQPASDIDLAISAPEMSRNEWARLLNDLYHSRLIYEVDVIQLESLDDASLRNMIERDSVCIYERKAA